MCSSGGLAAEEPGQRPAGGPLRRHPHAEEEASEHAELHAGSAQERPLETAGLAGTVSAGRPQTPPQWFPEWMDLWATSLRRVLKGFKIAEVGMC